MHFIRLAAFGLFLGLVHAPLSAAVRAIAPDNPSLRYVGRFDFNDPSGPRCAWSASRVDLRVAGGGRVAVRLAESNRALWQVVVDGEATGVISSRGGDATYLVAENLPAGEHTVALVKRTEFNTGQTQILGFEIDEKTRLLDPVAKSRVIEVIGDSISCGYGNEAASKEEHFSAETENAWLTYGAIAAEKLGADYVCVAWSGKKLWPDNTIVEHYDRVLPGGAEARWDFSRISPDVVVINLGTNDFARENPDAEGWVEAAKSFVGRVRKNHPPATIFLCVGTMMSDAPAVRSPRATILGHLRRVAEDARAGGARIHIVDFGVQQMSDGIGADWHPSVATHRKMADKLVDAIRAELGW